MTKVDNSLSIEVWSNDILNAIDVTLKEFGELGLEEISNHAKGKLKNNNKYKFTSNGINFFTKTNYAKYVEEGRPGFSVKNKKFLHFRINGKDIFCKSVGPAPAQPYFEPGVVSALNQIQALLDKNLERIKV